MNTKGFDQLISNPGVPEAEVLEAMRPTIQAVARRYAGREMEIEDLMQEALIKALLVIRGVREGRVTPLAPSSYLFSSIHKLMADRLKIAHRHRQSISTNEIVQGEDDTITIEDTLASPVDVCAEAIVELEARSAHEIAFDVGGATFATYALMAAAGMTPTEIADASGLGRTWFTRGWRCKLRAKARARQATPE